MPSRLNRSSAQNNTQSNFRFAASSNNAANCLRLSGSGTSYTATFTANAGVDDPRGKPSGAVLDASAAPFPFVRAGGPTAAARSFATRDRNRLAQADGMTDAAARDH
jgi:hypothetical protein